MSTELVQGDLEHAKFLATSNLLPDSYRGRPANVLVAIEYGRALGVPAVQALANINVINGVPAMSAQLMSSLVRQKGFKLRIEQKGQGREAVVRASLVRPDDPDFVFTAVWDWKRAEQANVIQGRKGIKTNWLNYPEAMLTARAITEVCRKGASDALFGVVYTPEELTNGDMIQVADIELVTEENTPTTTIREEDSFDDDTASVQNAVFDGAPATDSTDTAE